MKDPYAIPWWRWLLFDTVVWVMDNKTNIVFTVAISFAVSLTVFVMLDAIRRM